jgi:hypothetical protein
MTMRTILPTADPSSGFWAASERNGYQVQSVWAMASDALAMIFALTPTEVRDFLDSHAGRLLADDIGFIEGGPTDIAAIETLIKARLGHLGWQRLYQQTISEIRARERARKDPRSKHSNAYGRPMRPAHRPPGE